MKRIILPLILFPLLMGAIFWKSFVPDMVLFCNDGPLGAVLNSDWCKTANLSGVWNDLNWIGSPGVRGAPSFSYAFWTIMRHPGNIVFFIAIAILNICFTLEITQRWLDTEFWCYIIPLYFGIALYNVICSTVEYGWILMIIIQIGCIIIMFNARHQLHSHE